MLNWFLKKVNNKKGFTLIELIVVIAILGILAAVMIPRFGGFEDKARQTQALTDAKQIATAMDSLFAEKGDWTKITTAEVEALAGVESLTDRDWINTEDPDTTKDGSFQWGYTVGTKIYTAGRDSADDAVKLYDTGTVPAP